MYKKIVVNVCEHETRIALLEGGTIAELFIERGNVSDIAGNVYKGKVQRVLPGMQAAFVDIGLNQAAFIYVDDLNIGSCKEIEIIDTGEEEENGKTELYQEAVFAKHRNHETGIGELITEGQQILVQVARDKRSKSNILCYSSW